MKSLAVKIGIPQPCTQDWDSMDQDTHGKFCRTCAKTVVDFSGFTDAELMGFFANKADKICGRFHYSQLNRSITLPAIPGQPPVLNLRKFAATAFTILSLQGAAAQTNTNLKPQTVQSIPVNHDYRTGEDIVISGVVRSNQNESIKDVIVKLDSGHFVRTDKDGNFKLLLKNVSHSFNIYFIHSDSFVTTVRSYHPAMQSSFYEVVLEKRKRASFKEYFIGLPVVNIDFPSILFKKNSSAIGYDAKALLSVIASKLKDNPTVEIDIMAYPPACNNVPQLIERRFKSIIYFLSKKLGVSAERIFFEKIVGGGDDNLVELRMHER